MKKIVLYLRTDLVYQDFSSGGSVGHTLGVIQGFIDNGFEVVCITTCMKDVLLSLYPTTIVIKRSKIIRIIRWPLGCLWQSLKVIIAGRKILKKTQITSLYQRISKLDFSGIVLSWWFKVPLIIEYNGSESWLLKKWSPTWSPKILLLLVEWAERLILNKANSIVVVSKVLKEQLISRGIVEHKILINPNGVDVDVFDPKFTKIKNFECVKQL